MTARFVKSSGTNCVGLSEANDFCFSLFLLRLKQTIDVIEFFRAQKILITLFWPSFFVCFITFLWAGLIRIKAFSFFQRNDFRNEIQIISLKIEFLKNQRLKLFFVKFESIIEAVDCN